MKQHDYKEEKMDLNLRKVLKNFINNIEMFYFYLLVKQIRLYIAIII